MNKKNIITLIIAIIIFLGALAIFIYANNQGKNKTNPDETKSGQYFYDMDGKKYYLKDYLNKPTAILYWKSDNSYSYDIISLYETYYEEYKDKINFLAINVNEPDIDLELFDNVKAAGFKIPLYFDTDLTTTSNFKDKKLPYLVFIEEGKIAKDFEQTVTDKAFKANLDIMAKNY